MIDDLAVLRAFLAANSGLTALVGDRIYAGRREPPLGYSPADGTAICITRRGGSGTGESAHKLGTSFQIRVWGGGGDVNAQIYNANQAYKALNEALEFKKSGDILGAQEEGRGQTLTDPETEWPFVLCFFRAQFVMA